MNVVHVASVPSVYSLARRLIASVEAGKELRVVVEPWKKKRTVDQNSLYWATLTDISREAPAHMDGVFYPPDVWHEFFRKRFLETVAGPDGQGVPRSTTSLSTSEMADYITQIQAWAAEELNA